MSIFRVLAAILHLGNIEIGGADHAEVYSDDPALITFCQLMGIEMDTMSLWLINRKITTVNETMIKALNRQEVSGDGKRGVIGPVKGRMWLWL